MVVLLLLGKPAQAQPSGRHVYVPANAEQATFLPIKKGDVFDVRAKLPSNRRRHFLPGVLSALGIAAFTYQAQQPVSNKLHSGNNRPYLLPGIGLGIGAAAMEVFGIKKHSKAILYYGLYNKDSVLIASGIT